MENSKKIEMLLSQMTKEEIDALLEFAFKSKSRNMVEVALLLGADINLIHDIFSSNDLELLEFLITRVTKAQIDSEQTGQDLVKACYSDNIRKVKLMLACGVDPNRARGYCSPMGICTPLWLAIYNKNVALVRLLINAGEKIVWNDLVRICENGGLLSNPEKEILDLLVDSFDHSEILQPENVLILCRYAPYILKVLFDEWDEDDSEKLLDLCIEWANHENLYSFGSKIQTIINDIIPKHCKAELTLKQRYIVDNIERCIKQLQ